jgi:hypothetical protein
LVKVGTSALARFDGMQGRMLRYTPHSPLKLLLPPWSSHGDCLWSWLVITLTWHVALKQGSSSSSYCEGLQFEPLLRFVMLGLILLEAVMHRWLLISRSCLQMMHDCQCRCFEQANQKVCYDSGLHGYNF